MPIMVVAKFPVKIRNFSSILMMIRKAPTFFDAFCVVAVRIVAVANNDDNESRASFGLQRTRTLTMTTKGNYEENIRSCHHS